MIIWNTTREIINWLWKHVPTHETGGVDEINLGGLSGEPADTVNKSLFDAQTVLHATSDDTPVALTVTEQTVVGRQTGGNIAALPIGITDDDIVEIDHASVADDDYAKFTTAGLEGRSYQELVNDISGVIKATDVEVSELSTATYDDVQDYINFFGDRTLLSGGAISDAGSGVAAVASLTAWCKETDSATAVGKFFNYGGASTSTLTDLTTHYIYVDYNGGTPQLVTATDKTTHGFKLDHILVGTVFRNGATLHFHEVDKIGIGRVNRTDMHHREEHTAHRADGLVTSDGGSLALSIAEISAGVTGIIYEGESRHPATVDGSTWSPWWTDDSGSSWTEVTGQSTINNTQYNDITSGLVTLTAANRYAVHWVYVDIDGGHLHLVYGQGDYKANEAEEARVPSVLPPQVSGYGVLIAKVIVRKSTTALIITYPWAVTFMSSLAYSPDAGAPAAGPSTVTIALSDIA